MIVGPQETVLVPRIFGRMQLKVAGLNRVLQGKHQRSGTTCYRTHRCQQLKHNAIVSPYQLQV